MTPALFGGCIRGPGGGSTLSASWSIRGCPQFPRPTQINCGSGLARECAVSANINAEWADVFAGKLPQGSRVSAISRPTQLNCGSGLARECAVSANINAEWADVFAGKPAPTGFEGVRNFPPDTAQLWGLLANAQCQPTSMLNGPTSSRASPHRVLAWPWIGGPPRPRATRQVDRHPPRALSH